MATDIRTGPMDAPGVLFAERLIRQNNF